MLTFGDFGQILTNFDMICAQSWASSLDAVRGTRYPASDAVRVRRGMRYPTSKVGNLEQRASVLPQQLLAIDHVLLDQPQVLCPPLFFLHLYEAELKVIVISTPLLQQTWEMYAHQISVTTTAPCTRPCQPQAESCLGSLLAWRTFFTPVLGSRSLRVSRCRNN